MLRAIALRICESSTSSKGTSAPAGGTKAVAAGAAPSAGVAAAASTSRLTIRPPGPEPLICLRSMPRSSAMRRATGEALMRPPSVVDAAAKGATGATGAAGAAGVAGAAGAARSGAAGAAGGVAAAGVVSGGAVSAPEPASGAPLPSPAIAGAAAASAMISEISSSCAAITPIRVPVGTVAPSSTRTFLSTPEPSASTSMFALSVSISTTASPVSTTSPSFFSQ